MDELTDEQRRLIEAILARIRLARTPAGKQRGINQLARLTSLATRQIGLNLLDSEISTSQWFTQMSNVIIASHHSAAFLWAESRVLDDAQQLVLNERIAEQEQFLTGFRSDINNEAPTASGGFIASRSQQYGQAIRPTFYAIAAGTMLNRGFTLERNVLTPADHCEGSDSCIEQTARGDVPVGELVPIGSRICLSNCKCFLVYSNPVSLTEQIV